MADQASAVIGQFLNCVYFKRIVFDSLFVSEETHRRFQMSHRRCLQTCVALCNGTNVVFYVNIHL